METVKKVTLVEALRVILDQKEEGVFFSVEFIKRTTGELRKMVCRGGVKKYVNGKGMAYDPASKGLVGIWDSTVADPAKAYRMISAEGVKAVVAGGVRYEVIPA